MYCTNCGGAVRSQARFCTNCGTPVRPRGAVADATSVSSAPPQTVSAPATPIGPGIEGRVAADSPAAATLHVARELLIHPTPPKARHRYYRPSWVALGGALCLAIVVNALSIILIQSNQATSYWFVARLAGFIIYGLLTASVALGMFLSMKWRPFEGAWLVAERLHPLLLLVAGVFTTLHIAGMLLINFPVAHALVPFVSTFRTAGMTLGILSMYLGIALLISTYLIRFIGFRTWRVFHYAAFLAWGSALFHAVQTGHESGETWAAAYYAAGAAIVLVLLAVRVVRRIVTLRRLVPTAAPVP